jgi:hypothetical protein
MTRMGPRLLLILFTARLRLVPWRVARRVRCHLVEYTVITLGFLLVVFIVVADFMPGPKSPPAGCAWQEPAAPAPRVLVCSQVDSP